MDYEVEVRFTVRAKPGEEIGRAKLKVKGWEGSLSSVVAVAVTYLWGDQIPEGVTVDLGEVVGKSYPPVAGDIVFVSEEEAGPVWGVLRCPPAPALPYSEERYVEDLKLFNTMTRGHHITPQAVDFWVEIANGRE